MIGEIKDVRLLDKHNTTTRGKQMIIALLIILGLIAIGLTVALFKCAANEDRMI